MARGMATMARCSGAGGRWHDVLKPRQRERRNQDFFLDERVGKEGFLIGTGETSGKLARYHNELKHWLG